MSRIRRWSTGSTNRQIASAVVITGILVAAVKFMALGKDVIVAGVFGAGPDLDAFIIALVIPTFVSSVVVETIHVALLPTYIEVRQRRSHRAAHDLMQQVATLAALVTLALSVLLLAFSPQLLSLVGTGFSAETVALTRSLFIVVLPTLVLTAIANVWSSGLNAENRNAIVAAAPIAVPLLPLAVLAVIGADATVHTLAYATLAGVVAETVLLGLALRHRGLPLTPRMPHLSADIRAVGRQYFPLIGGGVIVGGSTLIDQSMATSFDAGATASLAYGMKAVGVILSIGQLALSLALLPHFSRLITDGAWDEVRATMRTWMRIILLVTVPGTLIALALSRPAVALVFERGAFGPDDTKTVADLQVIYLLQIPAFACTILYLRLISALKKSWYLMIGAVVTLALNIVGNIVLSRWIGLAGIALSTSVAVWLRLPYFRFVAMRALRQLEQDRAAPPPEDTEDRMPIPVPAPSS